MAKIVAVEVAKHEFTASTDREMPIAEVVRLTDFVNYQEGAVVSRALINRATGTVTLFAFDEGQWLNEHTAHIC